MARAAGVFSVGVPGGFPNEEALRASSPDILATNLGGDHALWNWSRRRASLYMDVDLPRDTEFRLGFQQWYATGTSSPCGGGPGPSTSVGAYVDGRPIPSSSSVLTKDASVKRGGGLVKCCWRSSLSRFSGSP